MTSRHHPTINPYVSDEMLQAFLRDLPPKETARQAEPLRVAIMAANPDNLSQRTQRMREMLEAAGCEVQVLGPTYQRHELPPVIYEDELMPWPGNLYPTGSQVQVMDGSGRRRLYDVVGNILRLNMPPGPFTVDYPYQAPTKDTAEYKRPPLERLKDRKPAGGCHPLLRGLINRVDR